MADTIRTISTLLTSLFQDGQAAGAITPQDMRDLIVSLSGINGGMRVVNNSGGTAQVIGTSYSKVNQWTEKLETNVTVDIATNERITIDYAGTYLICLGLSFSGTGSTEFEIEVQDNGGGTLLGGLEINRKLGSAGDVGSASVQDVVTLSASDYLELYVKADGASKDFLIFNGTLMVTRIG